MGGSNDGSAVDDPPGQHPIVLALIFLAVLLVLVAVLATLDAVTGHAPQPTPSTSIRSTP